MDRNDENLVAEEPKRSEIEQKIENIFHEKAKEEKALSDLHQKNMKRNRRVIWVSVILFVVMILCLMIILMISINKGPGSPEKTEAQQTNELKGLSDKGKHLGPSQMIEEDFVGTYNFTDTQGGIWELLLADNGIATIRWQEAKGDMCLEYEGEWDYNQQRGFPNIWFHDAERLLMWFPSGYKYAYWLCIDDNFIYLTKNALEQQDPTMRLPIKKVK